MTPSVTEEYVPQYAPPVSYGTHHKALEVACYYQNRYTELILQLVHYKGLVEMFCLDAEAAHGIGTQRDGAQSVGWVMDDAGTVAWRGDVPVEGTDLFICKRDGV